MAVYAPSNAYKVDNSAACMGIAAIKHAIVQT